MTHILMADDDEGDIVLAQAGIQQLGVQLDAVRDGASLLRALEDGVRPTLILLDINMPGMDGHDTLAAIRAEPAYDEIPVVMLTTSDADADIAMSHAKNAFGYIHKPLTAANLDPVLRAIAAGTPAH